uniref:Uncharacterized protein n=1 Tax=Timema cristinae TaxID=61476 RepID=A0A7R9DCC5_TIMCR|nr:unnamed protein product [Timema cristinae]
MAELVAVIREKGWVVDEDASLFTSLLELPLPLCCLVELSHPLLAIWDVDPLVVDCGTSTYYERCKLAFHNLRRYRARVAAAYNRGRLPVNVSVNDKVMCRTFPLSSAVDRTSAKLTPKWSGPWKITSFLTHVSVILELVEDQRQSRWAHMSTVCLLRRRWEFYKLPTCKTDYSEAVQPPTTKGQDMVVTKVMMQYMKELEQKPFDPEEFVERLAWRTIEGSRDGTGQFDPVLLHETFVQAINLPNINCHAQYEQ